MKREVLEGHGVMKESLIKKESDTGLIHFTGKYIKLPFDIISTQKTSVRARVKMVDILYNAIRIV